MLLAHGSYPTPHPFHDGAKWVAASKVGGILSVHHTLLSTRYQVTHYRRFVGSRFHLRHAWRSAAGSKLPGNGSGGVLTKWWINNEVRFLAGAAQHHVARCGDLSSACATHSRSSDLTITTTAPKQQPLPWALQAATQFLAARM